MNQPNLTEEQLRKQISECSYADLLRINRFAPATHPYLKYAEGAYFRLILSQKKAKLLPSLRVGISNVVGWNPSSFNNSNLAR